MADYVCVFMHRRRMALKTHRYDSIMIACSICSHSDWCDGGDTCDCACHDDLEGEFDTVEDDPDEDDDEENDSEED